MSPAHSLRSATIGSTRVARTAEPLDRTFGLAIFEASDEAAARRFMEADPAMAEGVMTATLHPYRVAVRGC